MESQSVVEFFLYDADLDWSQKWNQLSSLCPWPNHGIDHVRGFTSKTFSCNNSFCYCHYCSIICFIPALLSSSCFNLSSGDLRFSTFSDKVYCLYWLVHRKKDHKCHQMNRSSPYLFFCTSSFEYKGGSGYSGSK